MVIAWVYGIERFLGDIQTMFQWDTETTMYRCDEL